MQGLMILAFGYETLITAMARMVSHFREDCFVEYISLPVIDKNDEEKMGNKRFLTVCFLDEDLSVRYADPYTDIIMEIDHSPRRKSVVITIYCYDLEGNKSRIRAPVS